MMIQLYGGPFDGMGQSIMPLGDVTIGRQLRLPDPRRSCWLVYKSEGEGRPFNYVGRIQYVSRTKNLPPHQEKTP